MVMTDKQFCDQVHMNIHAVRLLSNYKPSEMEKRISKLVIERYSNECPECKNIGEAIRISASKPQQSFVQKLMNKADNA